MATVNEAMDALLKAIRDPKRFAIGGEIRALIDAACQEERERIRKAGVETDMYTDWHRLSLTDKHRQEKVLIVPVSVLAPKEATSGQQG